MALATLSPNVGRRGDGGSAEGGGPPSKPRALLPAPAAAPPSAAAPAGAEVASLRRENAALREEAEIYRAALADVRDLVRAAEGDQGGGQGGGSGSGGGGGLGRLLQDLRAVLEIGDEADVVAQEDQEVEKVEVVEEEELSEEAEAELEPSAISPTLEEETAAETAAEAEPVTQHQLNPVVGAEGGEGSGDSLDLSSDDFFVGVAREEELEATTEATVEATVEEIVEAAVEKTVQDEVEEVATPEEMAEEESPIPDGAQPPVAGERRRQEEEAEAKEEFPGEDAAGDADGDGLCGGPGSRKDDEEDGKEAKKRHRRRDRKKRRKTIALAGFGGGAAEAPVQSSSSPAASLVAGESPASRTRSRTRTGSSEGGLGSGSGSGTEGGGAPPAAAAEVQVAVVAAESVPVAGVARPPLPPSSRAVQHRPPLLQEVQTQALVQKKRRKRNSVGFVAGGGLLTDQMMQDLSSYAESKKRAKKMAPAATATATAVAASPAEVRGPFPRIAAEEPSAEMPPASGPAPRLDLSPSEAAAAKQPAASQVAMEREDIPTPGTDVILTRVLVAGIPVSPPSQEGAPAGRQQAEEAPFVAAADPVINEDDDPMGFKSVAPAAVAPQTSVNGRAVPLRTFDLGGIEFTPDAIRTRTSQLFPDRDVLKQPCVSARLFACALLVRESSKAREESAKHVGRRLRGNPASHFKFILPVLDAFVQAELASADAESQPRPAEPRRKRLHFSSFDGSATMPPVDRNSGSNTHLEKNIYSLEKVFLEIDSLVKKASVNSDDAGKRNEMKECLDVIIFSLYHLESDAGGDARKACSESMPFYWPAQRFVKAAQTYREEFEGAQLALVHGEEGRSSLKNRLGDFVGRAVRYYLRRFFDPVPPVLTNEEHEAYVDVDLTAVRSCIHEIVEMRAPDGDDRDTAISDGSISSVFSYALRALHELFAMKPSKMQEDGESLSSFFASSASRKGLGDGRSVTIILTDDDLCEILADIHEVHVVLQGVKASKFVCSLLRWPGVGAAIRDAGGWGKVEQFVRVFNRARLEAACPEEAYFTLLSDIEALMIRLNREQGKMEELEQACEESLRKIWKKFRCGTRSKAILKQNPHISTIAAYLRDGKNLTFPDLAEPCDESDDDEE